MSQSILPSPHNDLHEEARQGEVLDLGTSPSLSKKIYLESYGCQMNFADSEVVAAIMATSGFGTTTDVEEADAIFLNTCAIRDHAEYKVRQRLTVFAELKARKPHLLIGMLGCMAERLKTKLLEEEKLLDIVAGPDAYRSLPQLVADAEGGKKGVNVFLSREETYAELNPVRIGSNGISAFISIMRGCDNMCSFCVVPFTRGRERSRDPHSILREAAQLSQTGYKEITLLGQNVDSYKYTEPDSNQVYNFANLLDMVARQDPTMRVRFSTSHPKDITEEVVRTIAAHPNLCNCIHLPVQSGNSRILDKMNRGYTREWYLDRIKMIRDIIPDVCLSTDIITGFCSETEEEHNDTLTLMQEVKFDYGYMFMYCERPGTLAAKKYRDDIPDSVKQRRLEDIIAVKREASLNSHLGDIGKTYVVLAEGPSKRDEYQLKGRTDGNKVVVFDAQSYSKGDYVQVFITDCTSGTLIGTPVGLAQQL